MKIRSYQHTGYKFLHPLFLILLFSTLPILALADDFYRVKRVIDGDTILLANDERVRLIGVDTPEVHESEKLQRDAERSKRIVATIRKFGKRSSAFLRDLVNGKRVKLEYDQANAAIGHRDRYGRILAYVFLEDGTFLNTKIIIQGYGVAYTKYPFKYADEFRKYQREARGKRMGLWGR
jgi:micrococcal nuclease